ncbi:MAG: polysaccharide pyruvyl transferase family protein [Coriobacteriia bacterium]|nr:polysaccharide pyruvyl transferase family protein [Coriobacteriia bacterium]
MSRRVAIMSRHAIGNYGSLLQAYALQTVLQRLGHDPLYVDYRPHSDNAWCTCRTIMKASSKWNRNPLTRLAYLAVRVPETAYRDWLFGSWRKRLLKVTNRKYRSHRPLSRRRPDADVYCTGSDQVWNVTGRGVIDPAYLFCFLPPNVPRFSYAASLGKAALEEPDERKLRVGLKRYAAVSVREGFGVDTIEAMGYSATHVLDPTMLLCSDDWASLMPSDTPESRYVLAYQMHWTKESDDWARRVSDTLGLELIRITTSFHDRVRAQGKVLVLPTVGEFLWYVRNADLVLTDSFHGTAFSIVFNRPFLEILPSKYPQRNLDLLNSLGLTDRVVTVASDPTVALSGLDYRPVNQVLDQRREESLSFLRESLAACGREVGLVD